MQKKVPKGSNQFAHYRQKTEKALGLKLSNTEKHLLGMQNMHLAYCTTSWFGVVKKANYAK
jgi:hypothetical protein